MIEITVLQPVELWTGKQLFSVLLRPHATMRVYLTLTVKEKSYNTGETMCEDDGFVYFRNSELVSGQLGKATLGQSILLMYTYSFAYWLELFISAILKL